MDQAPIARCAYLAAAGTCTLWPVDNGAHLALYKARDNDPQSPN